MKYLIDNEIEFNSDDGTLHYPASQDVIKLTLPAARLLEEFLSSEGRDLTREYLLETVWDKHGLHASGNNLNQYVSIVRRNLALFECHELIITLPKVGFKLNPAVSVQRLEAPPPAGRVPASPSPLRMQTPDSISAPVKPARRALFILLCLLVLVSLSFGAWKYDDATNGMTEIKQPDTGCDIIFLKDISDDAKTAVLERVSHTLKTNNLTCNKTNVLIYNSELSYSSQNNARTLLSLCTRGNNNEIISCDNFYHYKWIKP
ncbi:UNVERIFIED_ORG: DNA-binding winged helix-turn-helix (wHTH) protein [Rahnella aquatilis]|uniref:winged helix-turn-helix domain-containing protein n=1 Tax=Rahnella sp. 2050 TaxID=3156425 RepID=UPI001B523070|nr:DNA-binding winged helix-turn-helix (wHTH) protein [Rahnella aquatilis]